MKFSTLALMTAAASASSCVAQESLDEWWSKTALTIFPNTTGWEDAYDNLFSRDLKATFNFVDHDFESLKTFFRGVESVVTANYDFLRITPVDQVVVPALEGQGGIVYMTGLEDGRIKGDDFVREERDAVFAIVNDERKVTEWRESTNFF